MKQAIIAIAVIVLVISLQSCGDQKHVVTVISKHANQTVSDKVVTGAAGWQIYDVVTESGDTVVAKISPDVVLENMIPFKAEMGKALGAKYGYISRSIGHNTEPAESHAFLSVPHEHALTDPETVGIPCEIRMPISNVDNVVVIFDQRIVRAKLDTTAITTYGSDYLQIQQALRNHQVVKCLMNVQDKHFVIVSAHVEELPDGPDTIAQNAKPVMLTKTAASKKSHGLLSQPKQD